MKKKLIHFGNSYALIIEKALLELYHIKPTSDVVITPDKFGFRVETSQNMRLRIVEEAKAQAAYEIRDMLKMIAKMRKVVGTGKKTRKGVAGKR